MKFKVFTPGLLLGAAAGAYLGISGYMAAHMSRVPRTHPEITPGSLGLDYEDVAFFNRGGPFLLKGWLTWESTPRSWVILVHGNGGNRADLSVNMLGLARDLASCGSG